MSIYRIAIVRHLSNRISTRIEQYIFAYCKDKGIECIPYDENDDRFYLGKNIPTLFVAIGGDGTMLYTVKESIKFDDATILGISAGTLNFLTDQYSPQEAVNMIDRIHKIDPDLLLDDRTLVKATYKNETVYALNEISVTPMSMNTMMRYSIGINGKQLATQGGSGVLVATATGSTAMAMSSGGSIVSPTSKGLQIVPIASHSLSSRPVVVSSDDDITIDVPLTDRVKQVQLSADGREVVTFNKDNGPAVVTVTAALKKALIWRDGDWNFFDVLRDKMGWDS